MKRAATESNGTGTGHVGSFLPVFDSRKRKVPGLWRRGTRYHAQLRVDLGNGRTAPRRLALNAGNLDEAKGESERKRTERRDGKLPTRGHRPAFDDFAREYLDGPTLAGKKPGTQAGERQAIARWTEHLVRAYRTEQWGKINRRVEPTAFYPEEAGRVRVEVRQVVRDLAGAVLADERVGHRFTIAGGLIQVMEVGPLPSSSQST